MEFSLLGGPTENRTPISGMQNQCSTIEPWALAGDSGLVPSLMRQYKGFLGLFPEANLGSWVGGQMEQTEHENVVFENVPF